LEAPKFFVFTIGFFRKRIKSQALGMTILLRGASISRRKLLLPQLSQSQQNCHPDRSEA
jgi:hypothetical protein